MFLVSRVKRCVNSSSGLVLGLRAMARSLNATYKNGT